MYYGIYREVPPGAIRAKGHLEEFLKRQKDGLSGNFAKQGYPFNNPMWNGGVGKVWARQTIYQSEKYEISPDDSWWPYEQSGYLLDGLLRLGLLTDDRELLDLFRDNLEYVIAHPSAQGLLGHCYNRNPSEWPMAVFFKAVIAYYEATGDERVKEAFHRHFSQLSAQSLMNDFRNINNLEGVLKLYEWSGDETLKAKAEETYRLHNEYYQRHYTDVLELYFDRLASSRNMVIHGVSFCESLKLPVLLYLYTGKRQYLNGAVAGLNEVLKRHEQLPGLPSSNEFLSGRDPLEGYETCLLSDFQWSIGYFLMATGSSDYADRLEKVAYNALPGSITKDFTALQYLSAPNQVIATPGSNHSHYHRGESPWRQYRADHYPQCCPGNVHRAMPIFVMRMWMQDIDGAPVAAMYGPSELNWQYQGQAITITEETEYPYGETIAFRFRSQKALDMPFTFRIPAWCRTPELSINGQPADLPLEAGQFHTLTRTWQDGDRVELKLPMRPIQKQDRQWNYYEYGPLLFSYPIQAQVSREGDDRFSPYVFQPDSAWNYAVAPDTEAKVVRTPAEGYPLDSPPVKLLVKARPITGYDALDQARFTPPIPLFANPTGPEQELTLVPFGSTILRVTAFPDGKKRTLLPVYQVRAIGPYPYDYRRLLKDQSFIAELLTEKEFHQQSKPVQPDSTGYYDLIHHFCQEGNVLAYLKFRIWSDCAGKAIAAVGASDAAEGFLHGVKCLEIEPPAEAELVEPQWFPIQVKAGWNDLLLKVADGPTPYQYRRAWGARVTVFMEQAD